MLTQQFFYDVTCSAMTSSKFTFYILSDKIIFLKAFFHSVFAKMQVEAGIEATSFQGIIFFLTDWERGIIYFPTLSLFSRFPWFYFRKSPKIENPEKSEKVGKSGNLSKFCGYKILGILRMFGKFVRISTCKTLPY